MSRYVTGLLSGLSLFMAGANWLGPTTFLGRPAQLASVVSCLIIGVVLQVQLIRSGRPDASTTRD
jgi:hypothetical protein